MAKVKQISPAPSELPIVKVDFDHDAPSLRKLRADAMAELEAVQGLELTTEDDAQAAAEVLLSFAGTKKLAAEQSKEWLADLKAEEKRIRAPFKAIEDLCDAGRAIVDKAIGKFQLAKAAAQRKALAEATAAAKKDDSAGLTTALQKVSEAAPTKLQGVSVKAFWVAHVRAPDMVPHAYLTPDLKKIGAHASAFAPDQEPTPIAGVVFTLETSTIARPGRAG